MRNNSLTTQREVGLDINKIPYTTHWKAHFTKRVPLMKSAQWMLMWYCLKEGTSPLLFIDSLFFSLIYCFLVIKRLYHIINCSIINRMRGALAIFYFFCISKVIRFIYRLSFSLMNLLSPVRLAIISNQLMVKII